MVNNEPLLCYITNGKKKSLQFFVVAIIHIRRMDINEVKIPMKTNDKSIPVLDGHNLIQYKVTIANTKQSVQVNYCFLKQLTVALYF